MSATTTLRMILLGEDKSAGKALKGVGDEADKSTTKMQKFHKVGAAAGIALAGGLALAGKAAFDMTKKAAADQAGAERLAQTLHKATGATKEQQGAVEDWISTQEKALGVSDDELRPALSKLAVATHSVAKAQKLASLAMNVSAGTGKSLESVSLALAKAQNGNISGLGRLGIATKDAAGKTLSLDQITKQLSDNYSGAAAKSADTAAGKQRILKVEYAELQEQIGAGLLPVMSKLLSIGLQVVDWVSKNTRTAAILVGVIGTLVAATFAVSTAIKLYETYTALSTAATWAWNLALDANPIGLIIIGVAALVAGLVIFFTKTKIGRAIVEGFFHGMQAAASFTFNWVKSHWALLFVILGGPIGLAAVVIIKNFDKIQAGIRVLGKWAAWLWNNAFQPAIKFIVNGIGILIDIWGHMLSALGHVPGFGWAKAAGEAMQNAADKAHAVANAIQKIPTHKNVDINIVYHHIGRPGTVNPDLTGMGSSTGGGAGRGGMVGASRGAGATYITVNANNLVDPGTMARKIQAELNKLGRTTRGTLVAT